MNDSIKGLNVKKPKHVFFDIFLLILYRRLQYANHRSCLPYENVNLSLNLAVFEESIMMIDRVIIIVDNVLTFGRHCLLTCYVTSNYHIVRFIKNIDTIFMAWIPSSKTILAYYLVIKYMILTGYKVFDNIKWSS